VTVQEVSSCHHELDLVITHAGGVQWVVWIPTCAPPSFDSQLAGPWACAQLQLSIHAHIPTLAAYPSTAAPAALAAAPSGVPMCDR
jgi:hypothetical protein